MSAPAFVGVLFAALAPAPLDLFPPLPWETDTSIGVLYLTRDADCIYRRVNQFQVYFNR